MTAHQDEEDEDYLAEFRATVIEVGQCVVELGARVGHLEAAAGREDGQAHGRAGSREGSAPPRPWCWVRMIHAEKADRLAELADWVRDVLFAWPAAQRAILPCWSRHWDVIEELSLLYCAWRTAYLWDGRTDHHACEYLDRWLPNAVDRLAVRLRSCAERHHPDGARRDDAELVDRSIAELRRL
ncbi:MAG TPA: hypothetical protein VFV66_19415 [Nonomuraea sp.]|nr:hypothetical protein [Nonomuraea sp.]